VCVCVCVWKFILDLVLVKINIVAPISPNVKVFQDESSVVSCLHLHPLEASRVIRDRRRVM
jgi:hypothetical protein